MLKFILPIIIIVTACSSDCFIKKDKSGDAYIFNASGNEPFWNLVMNSETGFTLKNIEGFTFHTPPVESENKKVSDTLTYKSETEKGVLTITLFDTECADDMSGKKFTHKVKVELTTNTGQNIIYTGCGQYLK